ncbi:MAG: DnaJ domain-containing protein [Polyangiaceae bacterium]
MDTLYGYYDGVDLLERWGSSGVRGRALNVIWRVVEAHAAPVRIADVVKRLSDRMIQLHVDAPIHRFHFGRAERPLIELLRAKPQPLSELIARDVADRALVERLVYALTITRQIELGADVLPLGVDEPPSSIRPVAPPHVPAFGDSAYPLRGTGVSGSMASVRPSPTPSPPPAPVDSPEIAAFRAEIHERAARDSDTLYEVLGITKEVAPEQVQPVFLALAKKWHPDRLPAELAGLRELAGRVFSRMTEASQVLADLQQRREYDSKLRRAGREAEEQEHVQRVLRAARALQKADVFLKRNNLAAAETEARQALADDPDDPGGTGAAGLRQHRHRPLPGAWGRCPEPAEAGRRGHVRSQAGRARHFPSGGPVGGRSGKDKGHPEAAFVIQERAFSRPAWQRPPPLPGGPGPAR